MLYDFIFVFSPLTPILLESDDNPDDDDPGLDLELEEDELEDDFDDFDEDDDVGPGNAIFVDSDFGFS